MTAASARQGLASTSQAGPAGAVTDHSDCSGTAGIASIDNRLLTIGRRAADSTAGTADGQTSALPRARQGAPFPARADVRDCSAKPAPQRRRTAAPYGAPRRATAPSPTTRIRLCMGCPMRSPPLRSAATLCLMLSLLVHAAPPPLPAEHLSVQQLPPKSPHWVY